MIKYFKFSWKENEITRKSLIGISFDQETGYLKIRWLGGSALPATSSVISLLKTTVFELKQEVGDNNYYPFDHFRIVEKWGTSGCLDLIVLRFPFSDEFMDFGFISSHIHVSMYRSFNEREIFEGNFQYFKTLIERLKEIFCDDDDTDDGDIKNLEVKEFTPWGKYKTKKNIIDVETYEYEKF